MGDFCSLNCTRYVGVTHKEVLQTENDTTSTDALLRTSLGAAYP